MPAWLHSGESAPPDLWIGYLVALSSQAEREEEGWLSGVTSHKSTDPILRGLPS